MRELSLVEEEEDGLVFDVEQSEGNNKELELCLVGRFIIEKVLRVSIMKERMANIWRLGKGVSIRDVSPRVFLL